MEFNKPGRNKRIPNNDRSNSIRFSTQYSTKASDIQRVIQKNWNILKQDPILNSVLPSTVDLKSCFENQKTLEVW